jgi:hypothetical protein
LTSKDREEELRISDQMERRARQVAESWGVDMAAHDAAIEYANRELAARLDAKHRSHK